VAKIVTCLLARLWQRHDSLPAARELREGLPWNVQMRTAHPALIWRTHMRHLYDKLGA
jgi:hypothetical protein